MCFADLSSISQAVSGERSVREVRVEGHMRGGVECPIKYEQKDQKREWDICGAVCEEGLNKKMSDKIHIIVGRKRFLKFISEELEAIIFWGKQVMADLEEIRTALAGVKTGVMDVSASIQNISADQQGLLDKITALEQQVASGAVISAEEMAVLKQQAADLKSQTDQLAQFSKGVADAAPE
jgi:hypothetical protein